MGAPLSATKVKVNRELLIKRLQEVQSKGDSAYNKLLKAHEDAIVKAEEEVLNKLRRVAALPTTPFDKSDYRYGGPASINIVSKTQIPRKPQDVACDLRNTIAVLELSSEETVALSADQYARFFPCELK